MNAVVTVVGKDKTGIIARVATALYEQGANIEDISQTIMQGYFTMIMMVAMPDQTDFSAFQQKMGALGEEIGVSVKAQHTEMFSAMHNL
ncbi:MAG: ACT domain-containing protein [Clostridia bacterium]|nr:ACT domain-containing protein [Clostridia bacterium]